MQKFFEAYRPLAGVGKKNEDGSRWVVNRISGPRTIIDFTCIINEKLGHFVRQIVGRLNNVEL